MLKGPENSVIFSVLSKYRAMFYTQAFNDSCCDYKKYSELRIVYK